MIRIGICDDEAACRGELKQLLEAYFSKIMTSYQISEYTVAEKLLDTDISNYDLFCLDIHMPNGINGIEAARKIRDKNKEAEIIFITHDVQYACEAFEVNALRYLLKPLDQQKLYYTLDLVIKKYEERAMKIIKLNLGQHFFQIPLSDILFFETVGRKIKVHTKKKEYLVDNKIKNLEKELEDRNFFRVHKSYLVNICYVKEHDQSTVTMQNDEVVFVSRLKLKAFKESFGHYMKGKSFE